MSSTLSQVRQYLFDHYSDEEIITLCSDCFPNVRENFSFGMTKGQKIDLLFGYCRNHAAAGRLYDVLANGALFKQHFPDLDQEAFVSLLQEGGELVPVVPSIGSVQSGPVPSGSNRRGIEVLPNLRLRVGDVEIEWKSCLSMLFAFVCILGSLLVAASSFPLFLFPGGAAGGGALKIVSSLPLTGSSLTQTDTIVKSIQLKLKQINNQVCGGKYKVIYESKDDASAALGKWDPEVETENANKAAADKSVIAYIGTFNSGAAALSIPILNKAEVVMVSPANTYPGLTKPGKGDAKKGEPDVYYPNGKRNYARVVAADDVQGAVAANWAKSLGVTSVYILDDAELYGKGVADVFNAAATKLGMKVIGQESIDPKAADYKALMEKISTSNSGKAPDMIYVGMVVDNNAAQLLKDKVAVMGDNTKVKYMGPDGIQTQAFIDGAGADMAEDVYATVASVPNDQLPPAGQQYLKDYEKEYGKTNEPYAAYGYDAASAVIKAIEDVCAAGKDPTDRATVRDAVLAIKNFSGALGTWSFDANGDTTLTDMTGYVVKAGKYAPVGTFKAQ
jgi:branched-chain amino acid transport system substrate-binding protein